MSLKVLRYVPLLWLVTALRAEVDFAHDVLPILEKHCAECHTNGKYKGSFSMDTRAAMVGSESVVVGDAGGSDFIDRLLTDDPDDRMPQKADRLADDEIAALRKWIDEGVAWEEGFTFRKNVWKSPVRPRQVIPPEGNAAPVDRIVRAYFRERKVTPPAPLGDAAFARRAYLDLIGVLPTPEELGAFASDRAPDKRGRLVDALLARDEDYAAHWMTFWNDLLRNDYAGTGYIDGGRKQITGWLYSALLENKPYDDFVRELIDASPATEGFIRGIKWRGNVNASQVQEVQFAQNISQVFLGENMKCASCHDSFINDWKLADAYGLAAIIADRPLQMHHCDKPTGEMAKAKWLFPEIGDIDPGAGKKERLRQAAALMTSKDNGRFARTIVNRIWQRLMGRGLVEPVDIMGNRPWSEDLLDYVAWEFAEGGYDLKRLLAMIVKTRTYQSTCVEPDSGPAEDYVFRGPVSKRMTAEQFVDAVWALTGTGPGKPDAKISAPPAPRAVRASLVQSTLLMRALGRPNREQVVTTRPAELSTLQALELNNGKEFVALLERGAKGLDASDPDGLVRGLYQRTLCRPPDLGELRIGREILKSGPGGHGAVDLLWALLMLPEFQIVQ